MKNINWILVLLLTMFVFGGSPVVNAQTPTIIDGAAPLDRNRNLVSNGSFEEPHLDMGATLFGVLNGIDGDGYYWLSTITDRGPEKAIPDGWFTTDGGNDTYARWGNNINATGPFPVGGQAWSSLLIDGERSVYLGNSTPLSISETPTFMPNGEVVFSNTPTIILSTPDNPPPSGFPCCHGPDPFVIGQTVTGLIPGRLYRMSFWVSGEWSLEAYANAIGTVAGDGILGVDIEGYDRIYLAIPAGNAPEPLGAPHVFGTDEFHVYTLEFIAVDTNVDISFVNWGHFGTATVGWNRGNATEAIIDDVIINSYTFVLNPIFPALDDNINFISAENATPNENVAFVWGKKPGEFTLGGRICNGAVFGIEEPNLLAIERANEFGTATYIFYIPFFSDLEFTIQLHALDINTCRLSNQIEQVLRKDDEGSGRPFP